jgi:hypothetical protein
MKKLFTVLIALATLSIGLSACSREDLGPATTKTFDNSGFSRVEISSAFEVEVSQSSTYSFSINAQQKLFDQIKVTQNGDTLEINLQWGWGSWVSSWGYQRPKARITLPDLALLKISGATKGSIKGFSSSSHDTDVVVSGASSLQVDYESANARIEVSGASHVDGKVKAGKVTVKIDGASKATLAGSASSVELSASGASWAELEGLAASAVQVELSGASHATVSPVDKMGVNISGASSLTYTGNPSLDSIDVSGASTIHRK